jgi:hypothetical protein
MEVCGRFAVKSVTGDGNCLFQSLTLLVYDDESQQTALRKKRTEYNLHRPNFPLKFQRASEYQCL